ncbi:hypothetical protein CEUSTIGMA_g8929.t1 [Chlamydomonas eustigma]|uniref:Acyltransferase n=1 Tax=Chlamydomonas eustigma TaxID=1157962 RepID=A0A250XEM8_9CHLO|nr:hypothetical protein CEUSTIGMA_g8929.t1 [Chlamydomonas eustigma]|eukprot:GAX81501.1 hypothetical protein CEUSTIGMA_g8929.t1 [Chlamydomonas eustigma]
MSPSTSSLPYLSGLSVFVGAIYLAVILPGAILYRIVCFGVTDVWAIGLSLVLAVVTFVPLTWVDTPWLQAVMSAIVGSACDYFPINVIIEDEDSLKPTESYVIGYEPHSALPVGIPSVFSTPSPKLPKFLSRTNFHSLASSVCFMAPFVRQLWWLLGLRPATRETIDRILKARGSVLLCPGGVQECLHMSQEDELVYLKKRQGFVRMAMRHGSSLLPVFAFGQAKAFSWYRPGPPLMSPAALEWISRKAGAVPLLITGRWLTSIPHQRPITIVVGKPIRVPLDANPSVDDVELYLKKFIDEMQSLFDRNKGKCGYADMDLRVM